MPASGLGPPLPAIFLFLVCRGLVEAIAAGSCGWEPCRARMFLYLPMLRLALTGRMNTLLVCGVLSAHPSIDVRSGWTHINRLSFLVSYVPWMRFTGRTTGTFII